MLSMMKPPDSANPYGTNSTGNLLNSSSGIIGVRQSNPN